VNSRHHCDNHVIPAPVLFAQLPPFPFTLAGRVNAWRDDETKDDANSFLFVKQKSRMTSEHTDTTRLKDNTKKG